MYKTEFWFSEKRISFLIPVTEKAVVFFFSHQDEHFTRKM